MDLFRAPLGCFLLFAFVSLSGADDDVILRWNEALSDVLLADTSVQNPGMASRSMAMTNLAMYDALNSVSPKKQAVLLLFTNP